MKVLEEMKRETENENLKECTFKPKITKKPNYQNSQPVQEDQKIVNQL